MILSSRQDDIFSILFGFNYSEVIIYFKNLSKTSIWPINQL